MPADRIVHRWAALALVLGLCALAPEHAAGQQSPQPGRRKLGALGQNYPNPASPATIIPFTVGGDTCTGSVRVYVVTLRIYNILSQLVAVPKLRTVPASPTDSSSALPGRPVQNLRLGCGSYAAFWDGRFANSSRVVAPGTYVYELSVDGQREVKKMFVAR